ncbi:hypothetical protein [Chryseobacterium sp.]|uniref:hypothetical protein n=1 Tax=Chryseobacterium sp. TaxID=1871047 RepID=UPI00289C4011|nr:hypothetical protein [Chryseobacterium sp.]
MNILSHFWFEANIKLSNGKYLVDGKKINAFTNEEEAAVKLDEVVPFRLESKLIERGAKFEKSGLWQTHVTVDERVVTGQNPQSVHAVGEAVLEELKKTSIIKNTKETYFCAKLKFSLNNQDKSCIHSKSSTFHKMV